MWRTTCCALLLAAVVTGGAPPVTAQAVELTGKTLPLISTEPATYRVRETHLKQGGVLPGEYAFQLKLRLSIDGEELKARPEQYQGTSLVPLMADLSDFRYTARRPGDRQHALTGREIRVPQWGRGEDRQARYKGRWDTAQGRFKFSVTMGMQPDALAGHLAGVWVPALVASFPEHLKVEKGFSWGQKPQPPPQRLEELANLQQWTLAGFEETGGALRLELSAESEAETGEPGQIAVLERRLVYDTGLRLVTRAEVTFETRGGAESERVELVMDLEKEQ